MTAPIRPLPNPTSATPIVIGTPTTHEHPGASTGPVVKLPKPNTSKPRVGTAGA